VPFSAPSSEGFLKGAGSDGVGAPSQSHQTKQTPDNGKMLSVMENDHKMTIGEQDLKGKMRKDSQKLTDDGNVEDMNQWLAKNIGILQTVNMRTH